MRIISPNLISIELTSQSYLPPAQTDCTNSSSHCSQSSPQKCDLFVHFSCDFIHREWKNRRQEYTWKLPICRKRLRKKTAISIKMSHRLKPVLVACVIDSRMRSYAFEAIWKTIFTIVVVHV